MTIVEFEQAHKVRLRAKQAFWWHRLIGFFWPAFLETFWTTIRLPFQPVPTIYYPTTATRPTGAGYTWLHEHELVHVEQQRTTWGLVKSALLYFLFPLPVLFSGRWFVERWAFLGDIRHGDYTPRTAARVLWRYYFYPWPPPLMEKWFRAQLEGGNVRP